MYTLVSYSSIKSIKAIETRKDNLPPQQKIPHPETDSLAEIKKKSTDPTQTNKPTNGMEDAVNIRVQMTKITRICADLTGSHKHQ